MMQLRSMLRETKARFRWRHARFRRNIDAVHVGNNVVLSKIASGKLMYLSADDLSLTPHLITSGRWERRITILLSRILRQGMSFVDAGANFGYFSLMAAEFVGPEGKVTAIEANPAVYELLAKNLEVNGYVHRSTCHNLAIYSERGEVQLQVMRSHLGSSSLVMTEEVAAEWHDSVTSVTVPAAPLDEILGEQSVDVMKIDIEGGEANVFAGATKILTQNPNIKIVMEFSPAMLGGEEIASDLLDRLMGHGLHLHRIDARGYPRRITKQQAMQSAAGGHTDLFLSR